MKWLLRRRVLITLVAAVACLVGACSGGASPDDAATNSGAAPTQSTPLAWDQAEADRVEAEMKTQLSAVWAPYLQGGGPSMPTSATIEIKPATFQVQPGGVQATVTATITDAGTAQTVILYLVANGSKWAVVSMGKG